MLQANLLTQMDSGYALSRPGFQRFLFDVAEQRGVRFRFDSRVETIEDNSLRPVLICKNGSRIYADVLIGADGTSSAMLIKLFEDIVLLNCWLQTALKALHLPASF